MVGQGSSREWVAFWEWEQLEEHCCLDQHTAQSEILGPREGKQSVFLRSSIWGSHGW